MIQYRYARPLAILSIYENQFLEMVLLSQRKILMLYGFRLLSSSQDFVLLVSMFTFVYELFLFTFWPKLYELHFISLSFVCTERNLKKWSQNNLRFWKLANFNPYLLIGFNFLGRSNILVEIGRLFAKEVEYIFVYRLNFPYRLF